jgi:hypothetical protein
LQKTCDGGAVASSRKFARLYLLNFGVVLMIPVTRLRLDYEKYTKQEREAAEQLAEYQQRVSKALARLQRVHELQQAIKDRGIEIFSRGIEVLDE